MTVDPRTATDVNRMSGTGQFAALAYLFRPADPSHGSLVSEADPAWHVPTLDDPDIDVVIWGRLPRSRRPSVALVLGAIRREVAILRLAADPPTGFHVSAIHRLPPPIWRPGRLRRAIRRMLLSGLAVELVRTDRPIRVIDEVLAAAGGTALEAELRPSGDGSALARLPLVDGSSAQLRVAPLGHPKDPMHGRAALLALEAAGVDLVPRPVAAGHTAGAIWTTESFLSGSHAADLTPELLAEITDLCAALPDAPGGARAIRDQLDEVARVFPDLVERLCAAGDAAAAWTGRMPGVLLHGDLWMNNVLVHDGHLSGIVDWDTWHSAGVPGTDLLTLVATIERGRTGRDFGDLFVTDYWRSPPVIDVLRAYFRQRERPVPDARGLAAIAIGWWACRVFGALYRQSRPTSDPAWVRANVEAPLERLAALEREFA